MKKIIHYIIPIFFIIFLINPVFVSAGMASNDSTAQLDLNNTTESDQDIRLLQHLIEVDAVQFQSESKLYVRETLIFKNVGTQNFSGSLRTWVSDGAEIIKRNDRGEITKSEMTTGNPTDYLRIIQNGNIVSWHDDIETNTLASIYMLEYIVKAEPGGTLAKTQIFSKKLNYPTLINYKYGGRQGLPALILKITVPESSSFVLLDENLNKISSDETSQEGNTVISRFYTVQFKGFNIEISKPVASPAGIAGYMVLGVVIVLVLSYPIIRTRSGKIQALEEKIRSSLKREEAEETVKEAAKEISEEVIEEPLSEVPAEAVETVSPVEEDTEFEGKTREELENLKNEMFSKLSELDKEYESGNLLDEEYEELRKSYREKAERITKKMERL